jgi:hypothetical protein
MVGEGLAAIVAMDDTAADGVLGVGFVLRGHGDILAQCLGIGNEEFNP